MDLVGFYYDFCFFFRLCTGNTSERYTISIPMIGDNNVVFTGVGDLFAALFLAHSATKSNLAEALEFTIATVQSVLKTTLNAISATCGTYLERHICQNVDCLISIFFFCFTDLSTSKPTARQRELKMVQSKRHIENPIVSIRANKIE